MIYRDQHGYVMDMTMDGGDSANRAGLLALFGSPEKLHHYEVRPGWLCRHPFDEPWDNEYNFSRDQLLPFVAGCWKQGNHELVSRVFWAHAKRFFFAQNFERDYVGTKKYPYPHEFINDQGKLERRSFDWADPLDPSDIWHLILCAKIYWLYPFGVLGYPFLILSIIVHAYTNTSNDEGQLISKCVVAGKPFVWLYKCLKPDWHEALFQYWTVRRKMDAMCELITRSIQ